MHEIIEIPVFIALDDEESSLFKGQQFLNDKTYDGFRFLEYSLKEDQSVYFYIMELSAEQNNRYLWDRIIPKAACCLYLYDNDEKNVNRFFFDYERYKTPVFLIATKKREIPEALSGRFFGNVIYYDESLQNHIQQILKEILEKLLTSAE